MNYRTKLSEVLHEDENRAVKKLTEIRIGSSIDNLTVGELRQLSDYMGVYSSPVIHPEMMRTPVIRAMTILIERCI